MSTTYLLDRLMNEILLKEGRYDNIKPRFPGSFVGHRVEQEGKVSEQPGFIAMPDRDNPGKMIFLRSRKDPNDPTGVKRIPITKLVYEKTVWIWDGKDWVLEADYRRGRVLNPGEAETIPDAEKRLGKALVKKPDDYATVSYRDKLRGNIVSDPPKTYKSSNVVARPPFVIKKSKSKVEESIPKIELNVLIETQYKVQQQKAGKKIGPVIIVDADNTNDAAKEANKELFSKHGIKGIDPFTLDVEEVGKEKEHKSISDIMKKLGLHPEQQSYKDFFDQNLKKRDQDEPFVRSGEDTLDTKELKDLINSADGSSDVDDMDDLDAFDQAINAGHSCPTCNDYGLDCPDCSSCKSCYDRGCPDCQDEDCEKCGAKLDWSGICKKCDPKMWHDTMIGE